MYVVTFYSFKGGVGRTMCLVNIAAELAHSGKKVLIVDFDLEAPGIPTFELTAVQSERPGIVEFVTEYRMRGESPDVSKFVYCARRYEASGGQLQVMPAGSHDASYPARLNAIDWNKLYQEEDGYLLFEDLKSQWQKTIAPDYVLMDSRTGHSDVEGICTRQLPDAVCLLFFPNEQNLQGLKKVVSNVRAENASRQARRDPVVMHFVVSNVPDLDDEEGIVGSTLSRFQETLGYNELAGQIHHYNSLSLLNQEVFCETRPKSRLAREYKALSDAIVRENLSDRDVALMFLRLTARELRSPMARARGPIPLDRVEKILLLFPSDHAVTLQVALIYEAIGRIADALSLLQVDSEPATAHFLAVRARLHHRTGSREGAESDLREMLRARGAEVPSLLEALSIASQIAPQLFHELPGSPALNSLSEDERLFVAMQIKDGRAELPAKLEILESLYKGQQEQDLIAHHIALASIGLGQVERAIELLDRERSSARPLDISNTFNLAMAKLGVDSHPDTTLFGRVIQLDAVQPARDGNVNYLACISIAHAATGNEGDARKLMNRLRAMLRARPRLEFSPWTYTTVSSKEFLGHLDQLEQQLGSGEIKPAFACGAHAGAPLHSEARQPRPP